eukprot:TRINITY_DN76450_c0_g1_i1.p1 TRINITY_DN76450_c0_g1~~TRINITY_DN76450_c0_g1_i1.p1  ORF type:complete len:353 (+),score=57.11 TRINITY_DN76450_c0_g1_i1:83-1060(+)
MARAARTQLRLVPLLLAAFAPTLAFLGLSFRSGLRSGGLLHNRDVQKPKVAMHYWEGLDRHRKQKSAPDRQGRPYRDPFATNVQELDRMPMNPDAVQLDRKTKKALDDMKSEDVKVRQKAAAALWKMSENHHGAYNQLESVEASAENTLSLELLEALVSGCEDDDFRVRYDCATALGRFGLSHRWTVDPYIARVANKLQRNETSAEARAKLAESLGRIGTPAGVYSKAIGDNLEHEDWRVRLACVEAMDRLGPEIQRHYSRAKIVRLQRDDVELVRFAAEKTLFKIPSEAPAWLQKQNPTWRVRVLKNVKNNKGRRKGKRGRSNG